MINIEQVLAATPHKTPTIWPPASHHENYPSWTNQTCRTQLEKQGRAHKWCTPIDPPHMAKQKQDDQLEHTYSNYMRIRDVALKTCQRRWMIGRRSDRGSGISVLVARQDDDDDDGYIDEEASENFLHFFLCWREWLFGKTIAIYLFIYFYWLDCIEKKSY